MKKKFELPALYTTTLRIADVLTVSVSPIPTTAATTAPTTQATTPSETIPGIVLPPDTFD